MIIMEQIIWSALATTIGLYMHISARKRSESLPYKLMHARASVMWKPENAHVFLATSGLLVSSYSIVWVLVILIFWENGTSMRLRNRFLQVSLPFLGRFRSIRLLDLVWEFLLCGSWGIARMKAKNLDSESLNIWRTIQSISLLYVVICKWERAT